MAKSYSDSNSDLENTVIDKEKYDKTVFNKRN